jgi:hypothetical protein
MRIVSITDRPKLNGWETYAVAFDDETGALEKTFQFGGAFAKCTDPAEWAAQRRMAFFRLIGEAERDIAFRMFGDDWREHCSRIYEMTPTKARLLAQGEALRPDLLT